MESKQPNLGGCFRIFQNSFFIIWISASRVIRNVKYGKAMCCTRMEEEGVTRRRSSWKGRVGGCKLSPRSAQAPAEGLCALHSCSLQPFPSLLSLSGHSLFTVTDRRRSSFLPSTATVSQTVSSGSLSAFKLKCGSSMQLVGWFSSDRSSSNWPIPAPRYKEDQSPLKACMRA